MWHMKWSHKTPVITFAGQWIPRQALINHLLQRGKNKVRILVSASEFELGEATNSVLSMTMVLAGPTVVIC